jgi:hypothetical protein
MALQRMQCRIWDPSNDPSPSDGFTGSVGPEGGPSGDGPGDDDGTGSDALILKSVA